MHFGNAVISPRSGSGSEIRQAGLQMAFDCAPVLVEHHFRLDLTDFGHSRLKRNGNQ
jgi:hypothetical protein